MEIVDSTTFDLQAQRIKEVLLPDGWHVVFQNSFMVTKMNVVGYGVHSRSIPDAFSFIESLPATEHYRRVSGPFSTILGFREYFMPKNTH